MIFFFMYLLFKVEKSTCNFSHIFLADFWVVFWAVLAVEAPLRNLTFLAHQDSCSDKMIEINKNLITF